MIRLWITFAVFAFLIHLAITQWRSLSGKDKWTLTKSIFYSIMIALLTTIAMAALVIIF